MGLQLEVATFRVWGLEFGAWALGWFGVWDAGWFRAWGFGCGIRIEGFSRLSDVGFRAKPSHATSSPSGGTAPQVPPARCSHPKP